MARKLPFFDEATLVVTAINGILGIFRWLDARGVKRTEVEELLTRAENERRDVSPGEVQQVLQVLDDKISQLEAAADGDEPAEDQTEDE